MNAGRDILTFHLNLMRKILMDRKLSLGWVGTGLVINLIFLNSSDSNRGSKIKSGLSSENNLLKDSYIIQWIILEMVFVWEGHWLLFAGAYSLTDELKPDSSIVIST